MSPEMIRVLPVGNQQPALHRQTSHQLLRVPQKQACHLVLIVIQSIQQVAERRFDTADPQRLCNKNELLFHLSNSLFPGRMDSKAS